MQDHNVGNIVAFDIETRTGTDPHTGEQLGLDPRIGGIASIAFYSNTEQTVYNSDNEQALLYDIAAWLTNPAREPGVLVSWNGGRFDLPFLYTRATLLGVDPLIELLDLVEDPRQLPNKYPPIGGHNSSYVATVGAWDHIDLMYAYASYANEHQISNGLKPVAKAHDIDVIEVDRERIHELTASELVAYNMSDVAATHALALCCPDLKTWSDRQIMLRCAA